MSIPSITIRLDFGESGVSGETVQQGSAPVPVDLASVGASADAGGLPIPTGDPAAAATQAGAPMPSDGALGLDLAAAVGPPEPSSDIPGLGQGAAAAVGPPEPSSDIPGLGQGAAGGGEDIPQPESDASEKKTRAARRTAR